MTKQYDYIVVGAGSAGCPLAHRLSEDPAVSVLLIESGPPDRSPFIHMPRGLGKLLLGPNAYNWAYDALLAPGRRTELWLKGRTLGGSSSINGMDYVRGAPADYDHWAALGCSGWGWDKLGPLFVALEDHELGEAEFRGVGGPLKITMQESLPILEAALQAGVQMGVARVPEFNHVDAVAHGGMSLGPRTIYQGRRFSAARAFLDPIRQRPNLEIVTGSNVLKIEFAGRRATGVTVRDKSGTRSIAFKRELILCAGAVESPKLLQLSGVGPGALLQEFGIPLVHDAPGVGRDLIEHRNLSMQYRVTGGSENQNLRGLGLFKSLLEYLFFRTGVMSRSTRELQSFVKTRPGLDRPDAQVGIGLYSMSGAGHTIEIDPLPGITIGGYFLRPESRGEMRIVSADPELKPYIDANFLCANADRSGAIAMVHWIRRFATQPAFKPWIVEETTPGPRMQSDDEILETVMELGGTGYHVAGTCRMGSDAQAVLDPQLRVRGIEGVRVADTSIFPTMTSGNTNAPTMVIGLRAAQIIRQDA